MIQLTDVHKWYQMGEVRVTVSGVVSYIKARAVGGEALKAGTPIHVTRCVGQTMVLVKTIDDGDGE